MTQQQRHFQRVEARIDALGARIEALAALLAKDGPAKRVVDSARLTALRHRQHDLRRRLGELGSGGFGLLRPLEEELILIEDDFAAFWAFAEPGVPDPDPSSP